MSTGYHVPVLLKEAVAGLAVQPGGVYVDCTFGGGGHSRAILEALGPDGRLIAFDQDEDAARNLPDDPRLLFLPHNFRHVQRFLRLHGHREVDGLLADLGVSSHQFDAAGRGFSTRFEAALDMRMDRRAARTAAEVLATYGEGELHKLFERYGEVTNARTLARTIVTARATRPLSSVQDFKEAVGGVVKGNPNKYFAQVFQALRIEVNDELGALEELLESLPGIIRPGGRAAFITFHSLEDRLVKRFFRDGTLQPEEEHPFESRALPRTFRPVGKKPVEAGAEEQRVNPRSRSAKLRVAERT